MQFWTHLQEKNQMLTLIENWQSLMILMEAKVIMNFNLELKCKISKYHFFLALRLREVQKSLKGRN